MTTERKSFSILFGGDVSFGESYQEKREKSGRTNVLKTKGYKYSLRSLKPLLRRADVVVANLETPIANSKESPFFNDKEYVHYADAKRTPSALTKYGIKVLSLANNHSIDLGTDGLLETIKIASSNDMVVFGSGRNSTEAMKPIHFNFAADSDAVSLYVIGAFERRKGMYDSIYRAYAEPQAPGVNPLDPDIVAAQVRTIRAQDPAAFIVLFPHWGKNYAWKTTRQTKLAHACINAGVDLIIGHGAHMIQEIERYKGKWIVYSLGNLMFNSPGRYKLMKVDSFSMACRLVVRQRNGKRSMQLQLYPIQSDNRLTKYQPRPVNEEEFAKVCSLLNERVPEKAKWRERIKPGKDKLGYYLSVRLNGDTPSVQIDSDAAVFEIRGDDAVNAS